MQIIGTSLRDVKLMQPLLFSDERGWFGEVFHSEKFVVGGLPGRFVQDNQSFSRHGVLRGLHYQLGKPQGKLVRCLSGHIWDVAVDLRRESPDFGTWAGFDLKPCTEDGQIRMLFIPEGFAHGFLVLSEAAEVLYKTTDFYHPAGERCIRWDDPTLAISWPLGSLRVEPMVSAKDAQGASFLNAELP